MSQWIGRKFSLIILSLIAFTAVAAAIVTIDGRQAPYKNLTNVSGTSVMEMTEIRIAGLTQAAAQYRILNGPSKLPARTIIKMIWPDVSSENGEVVSPASSVGTGACPRDARTGTK